MLKKKFNSKKYEAARMEIAKAILNADGFMALVNDLWLIGTEHPEEDLEEILANGAENFEEYYIAHSPFPPFVAYRNLYAIALRLGVGYCTTEREMGLKFTFPDFGKYSEFVELVRVGTDDTYHPLWGFRLNEAKLKEHFTTSTI